MFEKSVFSISCFSVPEKPRPGIFCVQAGSIFCPASVHCALTTPCNSATLWVSNIPASAGQKIPRKNERRSPLWQRKQSSGSWQKAAARSTIFIPASGIWCGRPWRLPCGCSRPTATKKPPCWTVPPRSWNSSSWRRAPSHFSAPGAWWSCPNWTPPPTATKIWMRCAKRFPASKMPSPCWAACFPWSAASSRPASGRRSSPLPAKSSAMPKSWPNPSPMNSR